LSHVDRLYAHRAAVEAGDTSSNAAELYGSSSWQSQFITALADVNDHTPAARPLRHDGSTAVATSASAAAAAPAALDENF